MWRALSENVRTKLIEMGANEEKFSIVSGVARGLKCDGAR